MQFPFLLAMLFSKSHHFVRPFYSHNPLLFTIIYTNYTIDPTSAGMSMLRILITNHHPMVEQSLCDQCHLERSQIDCKIL